MLLPARPQVAVLTGMGFTQEQALLALAETKNKDADDAAECLSCSKRRGRYGWNK